VVVTSSSKRIARDVADVHAVVAVAVLDSVALVVVVAVVEIEPPQRPLPLTHDEGTRTRGKPDAIGTPRFPLESTVRVVHVYNSTRVAPAEYPVPLRARV
jgi:hypothetical protein